MAQVFYFVLIDLEFLCDLGLFQICDGVRNIFVPEMRLYGFHTGVSIEVVRY